MASTADSLDGFLPLLATSDTKLKLTIANNLINYLADPENSIECSDIGLFIDSLIPWMQSSNNKVSQAGIEAMGYLVDRMGTDFRPYIATLLPPLIDRLGDSKEVVREKAQLLLLRLAEREVLTPQALLEKLTPSFSHKNGKIREEVLQCLQRTLTEHGAASLSVSRLVPHVVKLMSDPMASVRDTAFNTLVEVYRHVGERLRQDLLKKHSVPAAKLPVLLARFDELRLAGDLLPSALAVDGPRAAGEDDVDRSAPRRASSVPRGASNGGSAHSGVSSASSASRAYASASAAAPSNATAGAAVAASQEAAAADAAPRLRRTSSLRRAGSSQATPAGGAGGPAGSVDESTFQRAFSEVTAASVFSSRELEEQLAAVRDTVGDPSKDWNKRVEALRKLRGLVLAATSAGGTLEEAMPAHVRLLEGPMCAAARDLRSQVVREACITIAYVTERMRNRADHFAEVLMPHLLQLIPNSAKVMASAGHVTTRFILRNTHAPRLVPPLCRELTSSKSRDIRRACAELLALVLASWPLHALERHGVLLQEAVRRGISDADPEARLSARKAYWSYRSHFPELAEQLLNSLDASYRRALNGEHPLSNSSSSNSLHHQAGGGRGAIPRLRMSGSAQGSMENLHQQMGSGGGASGSLLHRTPSLTRQSRSGIPVLAHKADGSSSTRRGTGASAGVGVRSSSAIDLQAAQRAKARAQYAALARHKVGSGASLPRPRKSSDAGIGSLNASAATSPERVGRTRCRVAGVSQSQPSSRSGSPSSRLSYATYSARMEAARGVDTMDGGGSSSRPRRLTGIPRSTGASREASRETSPNRFGPSTFGSKLGCRGRSVSGLERPSVRPVMAQKILQQSREAESAIADALTADSLESGDYTRVNHTRKRLFDDHSDDSETSSVCSERSFDSYRRPSDSFSWSGSQQRLYRENFDIFLRDISEIINNCASTHWADRKEGLVGLLLFLQSGQHLRPNELQRVTDIFTKMFMDSHTKVFSLFLDTLWELLQAHRANLNDWLYVLLTRLLNKLGTDLLNSIHTKIQRLLAHVRESFPPDLQLASVLRFLTDATQTPNAKVRTATLTHLAALCSACEDPSAMPTNTPASMALAKIVSLTADGKQSGEVRRAARGALLAMFDMAAPQVAMMLAELPREYQEIASPLLQSHVRRSSSGGTGVGGAGGSPPSPERASPSGALSSPGTPQTPRQSSLANRTLTGDEEDLNPEEVYRSLRRTTQEIQSYPFGDAAPGTGNIGNAQTALGGKLPDRDRDTTSQDSGISQMSAGAGDKLDALEEHFESLSLTRNNSGRSSSLSSPTQRLNSLQDYNGLENDNSLGHTENGFHSREAQEDSDAILKALEIIRPKESPDSSEAPLSTRSECQHALISLQKLAKEANVSALTEHFRPLLRVLLELLGRPDEPKREGVLGVLSELLLRREVAPGFNKYVELLVLKVLEAYKDSSKEVVRMAEVCSASVGAVLPPDTVIRVLNPLITTGDYPVNLGAIKMLMKVVESRPKEMLEPHLDAVMPALIKAYNNDESSVRKSAVFCMVALHNALGESALQPHLAALSGSKLKLLHLYIRRAQSGGGSGGGGGGGSGSSGNASAPTSPKNNQAP